jgi:hypothetical protein
MNAVTTKLGRRLWGTQLLFVEGKPKASVSVTSTKQQTATHAVNTAICLRTVNSLCSGTPV